MNSKQKIYITLIIVLAILSIAQIICWATNVFPHNALFSFLAVAIFYWCACIAIIYLAKANSEQNAFNAKSGLSILEHIAIIGLAPIILPLGFIVVGVQALMNKNKRRKYISPQKPKSKPELTVQDGLNETDEYVVASKALGEALLKGNFGKFETLLSDDVELILYENNTIVGRTEVIEYWKGWREKYVATKKVLEFEVVFSGNIARACLKLKSMVAMFRMVNGKINMMLFSPRVLDSFVGFSKDDLLALPMDLKYAEKHFTEIHVSEDMPFTKDNRIPCLSCGSHAEKLEWHGFLFNRGNHGYTGKISICPQCHRIVELRPEIRLRYETPQFEEDNVSEEKHHHVELKVTGTMCFFGTEILRGSKYVSELQSDVMFKKESFLPKPLPEFGPFSVKQIAEDCNWFLLQEMNEKDPDMFNRVMGAYLSAIEDGIFEAANNVGIWYYNYADNKSEGLKYLQLAIQHGSPYAMQNYFTILITESKVGEAVDFLAKICSRQDASIRCLWNYAVLLCLGDKYKGNTLEPDFDKAKSILQRIIDKKDIETTEENVSKFFDDAQTLLDMISDSNEYSLKGMEFHELLSNHITKETKVKNKVDVFNSLNELSLPQGDFLGLHIASSDTDDIGDHSEFYIYKSGVERDKDVLRHLITANTPMAAWQIYLLKTSPTVMPVFWHGGYMRRTYIFSKENIKQIDALKYYDLSNLTKENLLLPTVTIDKQSKDSIIAHVYCTFWNEWKGLVREHIEITISNNRVSDYKNADALVLHHYNCGILF